MKTQTRKTSVRLDYSRESVLASTRHILGALAHWMSLLLDPGAMKRLAGKGASLKWEHWNSPSFDLHRSNSYGVYIEDSAVLQAVGAVHSFADTVYWPGSLEQLETALRTTGPLSDVLKADVFRDVMDEPIMDPEACQIVQYVLDIAWTRVTLYEGRPVDLPRLAKVAGLTEKTVRMAAIRTTSNAQDLPTQKKGSRTFVSSRDATNWLARRPDYKPTRIAGCFRSEEIVPKTALELALLLRGLRTAAKLSEEQVAIRLRLKGKYRNSYETLEGGWWDSSDIDASLFDVGGIQRLGNILKVKNVAGFVRGVAEFMAPFRIDRVLSKKPIAQP